MRCRSLMICVRVRLVMLSYIQSESSVVLSIVKTEFLYWYNCWFCSHFWRQLDEFVCGKTDLHNCSPLSNFYIRVADNEWCEALLIKDFNLFVTMSLQSYLLMEIGFTASKLISLMLHATMNRTQFLVFKVYMPHVVVSHCATSTSVYTCK